MLLVMPATNAVSERSFSALKRVKTYLRSTMTQGRLNSILLLHVHHKKTDKIDLREAANKFVGRSKDRADIFGKFSEAK